MAFYVELATKAISRKAASPVNRNHMQKKNSMPETKAETRTAHLYCVVTGANCYTMKPPIQAFREKKNSCQIMTVMGQAM